MSIFYTADLHLDHKNAIAFDKRPWDNVDAMNEGIITKWNNKVKSTDTVYILGDLCMTKNVERMHSLLEQLNGQLYLIRGNHDHVVSKKGFNQALFKEICDSKKVMDEGKKIVLSHYPVAVWDCQHHGAIHLYGHVHNEQEALVRHPILHFMKNAYNVGLMNWNYEPVTLDEILARK